jgi:23S rRNA pseudouridine1911/1915/1917 synthase
MQRDPRPNSPNATLLDRLQTLFPTAKRTTLRRMLAEGRVVVNGVAAVRASQQLKPNDDVRLVAAKQRDPSHLIVPLTIVFEDADLLVVDKPAGLLTSTVAGEKRPTALALVRGYVSAKEPKARVGLIHRLDRDASGLLVFSKSHRAYESLKTQFFKHTVERIYEATVHGLPEPAMGTIESRLVERADGSVYSTRQISKGQFAVTEYELVGSSGETSTVRVRLQTGRKHQIRVHFSEKGWPIVGDSVYGGENRIAGGLRLRAVRLEIDHPITGRRMTFDAPVQPG